LHQLKVSGFVENIVPDNNVYPIHATPGVNRGYMKGVLDDSLRLVSFTAACGPVIFNSHLYGKDYYDNAFVAEPAANLIKRDVLTFFPDSTTGSEAYHGKEFLASTDERFRPVNLYVGPDGALYVVDMYRGIIQHKTYLTHYLAGEIIKRGLEQPLNCGRIYKITSGTSNPSAPMFNSNNDSLISYLNSSNQWLREAAHNFIVDRQLLNLSKPLRQMILSGGNLTGRINALWVLEGLHLLTNADLAAVWQTSPAEMKQQILTAAIAIMRDKKDAEFWLNQYSTIMDGSDVALEPYIAYLVAATTKFTKSSNDILLDIAAKFQDNSYVSDAVINGLYDKEESFLRLYQRRAKDTADAFVTRLKKVIKNAEQQKEAAIADKNMDKDLIAGRELFKANCLVCHGQDGNGVKGLGAPLNGSDWVQGDKTKLLSIVLYGLTGPVKVAGKLYVPPDVAGEMPAMVNNDKVSDADIAQIASYIRHAWSNKAGKITEDDVKAVRQKYKKRDQPFTMKELTEMRQ
jgi:mono/diheme cytochrome c family protein